MLEHRRLDFLMFHQRNANRIESEAGAGENIVHLLAGHRQSVTRLGGRCLAARSWPGVAAGDPAVAADAVGAGAGLCAGGASEAEGDAPAIGCM